MFGAVSPYKGIEEVIKFWNQHQPAYQLVIVGRPDSSQYGASLRSIAGTNENITFRLEFVTSEELQQWLSLADCCLYNYRQILTSGSIHPPRALGIPVLLPERLTSIELGEPNSRVLRFSCMDSLESQLKRALELDVDYHSARPWREEHDWASIAEKTMDIYRHVTQTSQ
jgi:glycosyltransferase involved in cell wall biosynthesis